ncbi:hypothetical protein H4219_000992 [Mycoemilia scoparia]|uniref:PIN domain-containing protein n=1 Tax=Mycoemilia scoparia TaxID=417184 RepID=A0A9W8A5S8_9FUNG|nr:hypothetical protein H4219_000992 [Mycoemilia scoparia]
MVHFMAAETELHKSKPSDAPQPPTRNIPKKSSNASINQDSKTKQINNGGILRISLDFPETDKKSSRRKPRNKKHKDDGGSSVSSKPSNKSTKQRKNKPNRPKQQNGKKPLKSSDAVDAKSHSENTEIQIDPHLQLYKEISTMIANAKDIPPYPSGGFSKKLFKDDNNRKRVILASANECSSKDSLRDRALEKARAYWKRWADILYLNFEKSKAIIQPGQNVVDKIELLSKLWRGICYPMVEQLRSSFKEIDDTISKKSTIKNKKLMTSLNDERHCSSTFFSEIIGNIMKEFKEICGLYLAEKPVDNNTDNWDPSVVARCSEYLGNLYRYLWQYKTAISNDTCDLESGSTCLKSSAGWYIAACMMCPNSGRLYHNCAMVFAPNNITLAAYYECRALLATNPFDQANESIWRYLESGFSKCSDVLNRDVWMWATSLDKKSSKRHKYLKFKIPKNGPESLSAVALASPKALSRYMSLAYLHMHRTLFTKIDIDVVGSWVQHVYIPILWKHLESTLPQLIDSDLYSDTIDSYSHSHVLKMEMEGVRLAITDLTALLVYGRNKQHGVNSESNHIAPNLPVQSLFALECIIEIFFACVEFLTNGYNIHSPQHTPNTGGSLIALGYINTILAFITSNLPLAFDSNPNLHKDQNVSEPLETALCLHLCHAVNKSMRLVHLATLYKHYIGEISINGAADSSTEEPIDEVLPEDIEMRGIKFIYISTDNKPAKPIKSIEDLLYRRKIRFNVLFEKCISNGMFILDNIQPPDRDLQNTANYAYDVNSVVNVDDDDDDGNAQCQPNRLAVTDAQDKDVLGKEMSRMTLISNSEIEKGISQLKLQRENLQSLVEFRKTSSPNKPRSKKKKKQKQTEIERLHHYNLDKEKTCIVFDTSCFISHLPSIQRAYEKFGWSLLVPLLVITELDGLKNSTTPKGQCAQAAVLFIEESIEQWTRPIFSLATDGQSGVYSRSVPSVRALTSMGEIHRNLKFRSEMNALYGTEFLTPDDLILESCLQYNNKNMCELAGLNHGALPPPVVLVTNDRNMRIKAKTRGILCLDIEEWLPLYNTR